MRKHIITITTITALATACKKDYWPTAVETTITPVATSAPANNVSVPLDPANNGMVTFNWTAAVTGNYTTVLYKVLFDKPGGNFSNPLAAYLSATQGAKTTLSLSHREMNKIAFRAGIDQLQKGKIIWTVVASNGVVGDTSKDHKVLELERPQGFAENPAAIYLLGAATEAGTDLAKAIPAKKLSDGVFELYTSLDAGTYHFVDAKTGTPMPFKVEGTMIRDGQDGNSPATTKTAYRIHLDFNNAVATFTEIVEVGLWFAAHNKVTQVLTYDAGGVWKAAGIAIVFKQESWGKDERYKFRVVEKDAAGVTRNVFQASVTKDNGKPNSGTAASYFYFKSADASQWDYTYKFEKEWPVADILVKFTGDNYTHQVVYK